MIYKKSILPHIKNKNDYDVDIKNSAHSIIHEAHTPECTPIHHDLTPLHPQNDHIIDVIPFDDDELDIDTTKIIDEKISHMQATNELPYQIYMSSNKFEDTIEIEIDTRDTHATLDLITTINQDIGHRLQLID